MRAGFSALVALGLFGCATGVQLESARVRSAAAPFAVAPSRKPSEVVLRVEVSNCPHTADKTQGGGSFTHVRCGLLEVRGGGAVLKTVALDSHAPGMAEVGTFGGHMVAELPLWEMRFDAIPIDAMASVSALDLFVDGRHVGVVPVTDAIQRYLDASLALRGGGGAKGTAEPEKLALATLHHEMGPAEGRPGRLYCWRGKTPLHSRIEELAIGSIKVEVDRRPPPQDLAPKSAVEREAARQAATKSGTAQAACVGVSPTAFEQLARSLADVDGESPAIPTEAEVRIDGHAIARIELDATSIEAFRSSVERARSEKVAKAERDRKYEAGKDNLRLAREWIYEKTKKAEVEAAIAKWAKTNIAMTAAFPHTRPVTACVNKVDVQVDCTSAAAVRRVVVKTGAYEWRISATNRSTSDLQCTFYYPFGSMGLTEASEKRTVAAGSTEKFSYGFASDRDDFGPGASRLSCRLERNLVQNIHSSAAAAPELIAFSFAFYPACPGGGSNCYKAYAGLK